MPGCHSECFDCQTDSFSRLGTISSLSSVLPIFFLPSIYSTHRSVHSFRYFERWYYCLNESTLETSLLPKVNQLVEHYSRNALLYPLHLVLNRVLDAVVNNTILDCFVESFFIACYYDCLSRDEIANYLRFLFQTNTKPNQKEFINEVISDWKDMEFDNESRKQDVLELLDEIIRLI